jgi:hypothetical protein
VCGSNLVGLLHLPGPLFVFYVVVFVFGRVYVVFVEDLIHDSNGNITEWSPRLVAKELTLIGPPLSLSLPPGNS